MKNLNGKAYESVLPQKGGNTFGRPQISSTIGISLWQPPSRIPQSTMIEAKLRRGIEKEEGTFGSHGRLTRTRFPFLPSPREWLELSCIVFPFFFSKTLGWERGPENYIVHRPLNTNYPKKIKSVTCDCKDPIFRNGMDIT